MKLSMGVAVVFSQLHIIEKNSSSIFHWYFRGGSRGGGPGGQEAPLLGDPQTL